MRRSGNDRILQRFGQIDKLCAVACDTHQQVFVLFRVFLSLAKGFAGQRVKLHMEGAQ